MKCIIHFSAADLWNVTTKTFSIHSGIYGYSTVSEVGHMCSTI